MWLVLVLHGKRWPLRQKIQKIYRGGHSVDANLHTKINDVVEAFRVELHQQAPGWSKSRTPSEVFDFEQGL
jgi:hypothetical protein